MKAIYNAFAAAERLRANIENSRIGQGIPMDSKHWYC
jgi:hypothetical protein